MKRTIGIAAMLGALTMTLAACDTLPPPSPAGSQPAATPSAPAGSPGTAPLSGELTLVHGMGSAGPEADALNAALERVRAENPDLLVNVDSKPLDQIVPQWNIDVAAGGGPDLFLASNDSLFAQADAGLLKELNEVVDGQLDAFQRIALEGSKVGTSSYMIPATLDAVALWYETEALPSPPATSGELLAGVADGSVKLGIIQNVDHQFGWTGAFGGALMDDTGTCIADEDGFADAFAYLKSLKDAGAAFSTDADALRAAFESGEINAILDRSGARTQFERALGDRLGATVMPAGPAGAANPLTRTTGWYVNPASQNGDLAAQFALRMVQPAGLQALVDHAGLVPADPSVAVDDPVTQAVAESAMNGLGLPQNAQFGNWWAPFGTALNSVVDGGADPAQAVVEACAAMNQANGFAP